MTIGRMTHSAPAALAFAASRTWRSVALGLLSSAALLASAACGSPASTALALTHAGDDGGGMAPPAPGDAGESPETYAVSGCSIGQLVAIAQAVDAAQIDAARLALDRSSDGRVKAAAQAILDDYTRSHQAMGSSGVEPVPGDVADAITMRGQQLVAMLRAQRSDTFDRSFVSNEILEQLTVLSLLQNVSMGDSPPEQAAQDHLSKAERHVRRQLERLVGVQRELVGPCGTAAAGCEGGSCEDGGTMEAGEPTPPRLLPMPH